MRLRYSSLLLALAPGVAHAGAAARATPTPFDGLGDNVRHAFSGSRLLFSAAAVAATGGLAFSGEDHALRAAVQRQIASPAWGDTAYYAGYIAPAVVAPGLYAIGLASRDRETTGAGAAALQALIVTLGVTGVLKVATGRPYPLHGGDPSAPDRLDHPEYAREFHPFRLKLLDVSWPSGHTSASVSIAAALAAYYSDEPWVALAGYPLALGIGFGMVDGDRHWTSDVISGALIGHVIGWSVGRGFRESLASDEPAQSLVLPRALPGGGMELDWVGQF